MELAGVNSVSRYHMVLKLSKEARWQITQTLLQEQLLDAQHLSAKCEMAATAHGECRGFQILMYLPMR